MDGLMLNTEDLYETVGSILMQRRGKTYRETVRNKMIGRAAEEAFGVLIQEENLADTWQDLQRETDEIFETILDEQLAVMNGLECLMQRIDKLGMPRCVATSSSRTFATRVLSQVGMLDRMDFVITAEDVHRGKPHPDIYLAAAQRLGVDVTTMLVLEDSPTGTLAGVSAGAFVVSVPNKHTAGSDFSGAQFIADGLGDPRIIDMLQRTLTAS
jgi:HAD superfamily hydrolase (TIGR01509 family)